MASNPALLGAQKDQRDYFTTTGDWLPVLRMDLNLAPDGVPQEPDDQRMWLRW